MINKMKLPLIAIAITSLFSCSKLDEKLNGQLTEAEFLALSGGGSGTPNFTALLNSAYITLYGPWSNQNNIFALQEHTTDEMIGPTRGGDWDDNGDWRVLDAHLWDANHQHNADAFRDLLRTSFSTTDLLRFNPSPQIAAEARFLRAFTNYLVLDNWDQVPYRENTTDPNEVPKVRKGMEAFDYIIKELNEIIPSLPDTGPAFRASKNAARVLLMKCYLNKGVYKNRQAPTFDKADMDLVISLADQITAQNKYSLAANYFANRSGE